MTPRQFTTSGIVLSRTDFGEADRILTFITPDHGKLTAIAKGVRKSQAKLAGAIELFSVSDLTVITGRGEISTLISARLSRHFGNIIKSIERTNSGYEFMRLLNKATEQRAEEGYFRLLENGLSALDDSEISLDLVNIWFKMHLLKITGHTPSLRTDESGKRLLESKAYSFDYDRMRFVAGEQGEFSADHIKFLRLGFGNHSPKALQRIHKVDELVKDCRPLIDTTLKAHLRI